MADSRVSRLLVLVERGVIALERIADAAEGKAAEPAEPVEGVWPRSQAQRDWLTWEAPPRSGAADDMLVEELELGVRPYNCLKRAGIDYVSQLSQLELDDFYVIPNLGKKSLAAIAAEMDERGLPHKIPAEAVAGVF